MVHMVTLRWRGHCTENGIHCHTPLLCFALSLEDCAKCELAALYAALPLLWVIYHKNDGPKGDINGWSTMNRSKLEDQK